MAVLFKAAAALLCSPLLHPGVALPTDQQPLHDTNAVPNDVQAVRAELKKAEIIPTVVDDFLPSLSLSVSWGKHKASLGNTLNPNHLQSQPTVALHDETNPDGCATTNMTYVVALTDPDAPSRDNPKWSEFCHWIAANVFLLSSESNREEILSLPHWSIPGTTSHPSDVEESSGPHNIVEYKPPGPPPKTGKHRYVFLVLAPRNGTTLPLNLSKPEERKHWGTGEERGGVRDWAEDNELVPVGANFIYAKNKEQ